MAAPFRPEDGPAPRAYGPYSNRSDSSVSGEVEELRAEVVWLKARVADLTTRGETLIGAIELLSRALVDSRR